MANNGKVKQHTPKEKRYSMRDLNAYRTIWTSTASVTIAGMKGIGSFVLS